nr:lytic transglycosylase domain-containing protein [Arenimonas composti]
MARRLGVVLLIAAPGPAAAQVTGAGAPEATRTVWRCTAGGTVSLATAPEPGSRCTAISFDADAAKLPDLWQVPGAQRGVLYEYRREDGSTWLSTRKLDGGVRVLAFSVPAPPDSPAHRGRADPGPPRWDVFAGEFAAAARASGVDEAWLRAVAQVESGFDAQAVSPKGAMGVMQLMPETAAMFEVTDPFDPNQSILAGALHLRELQRRWPGDLARIAAAYNAGAPAVEQYDGVPPYAETQAYVETVLGLHARYRERRR